MNEQSIRVFDTPEHTCPYLNERLAITRFIDPEMLPSPSLYAALSTMGYRRSGEHLYHPSCNGCQACIPVRIPVGQFSPRRRHRRVLKRNQDLTFEETASRDNDELFDLYRRYIEARHADGDMYPPSIEQFEQFLFCSWSNTRFLNWRLRGKLVAVGVTDLLPGAWSSVYTFFEPQLHRRSLGQYVLLKQIEFAATNQRDYLYLGYWVRDCRKMSYKSQYRPLQVYVKDNWTLLR